MIVKLKKRCAGPDGNFGPGETMKVDDLVGEQMIAGGYAEIFKAAPVRAVEKVIQPEKPAPESAAIQPEENAALPPPKPRRGRPPMRE